MILLLIVARRVLTTAQLRDDPSRLSFQQPGKDSRLNLLLQVFGKKSGRSFWSSDPLTSKNAARFLRKVGRNFDRLLAAVGVWIERELSGGLQK